MANIGLEALTFQGVQLLLPEHENQWFNFMITPEDLIRNYCPTLMSVEEAISTFKKFDVSNNNLLDYIELQKLNAYLFKHFPRLGGHLVSLFIYFIFREILNQIVIILLYSYLMNSKSLGAKRKERTSRLQLYDV